MQIALRQINEMWQNLYLYMSILMKELFLIVLLNMVGNYSLKDVSVGII